MNIKIEMKNVNRVNIKASYNIKDFTEIVLNICT